MNTAQYLQSGVKFTEEQKEQAEQLFLESKEQIEIIVHRLIQSYGGDFDDMMDEATCVFLAAFGVYDGSIPFSSWLRNWVRWELIDTLRVRLTRNSKYDKGAVLETVPSRDRDWSTHQFMENLSDDAALAIQMIFDEEGEFGKTVRNKGGQPRNYRSTLREYFYAAGWSHNRIAQTFNEIRFALMDC